MPGFFSVRCHSGPNIAAMSCMEASVGTGHCIQTQGLFGWDPRKRFLRRKNFVQAGHKKSACLSSVGKSTP
jgi:hypothetical protein